MYDKSWNYEVDLVLQTIKRNKKPIRKQTNNNILDFENLTRSSKSSERCDPICNTGHMQDFASLNQYYRSHERDEEMYKITEDRT